MSQRVQSIERGIDILSALAAGPMTVTQVAQEAGLSTSTAFRLLGSLRHRNMVVKDEGTNLYMLGPGWLRMLDAAVTAFQSIGILARKPMEELTSRTGETSVVHCRLGHERICLAQVPSANPVRYTISVGAAAPLHIGSSGRVLLAFGEQDNSALLDAVAGTQEDKARADLERQIDNARSRGYAVSIGELTPGAAGVSVPVRAADGSVVALSVIGPVNRFSPEHITACLEELRIAASMVESEYAGAAREKL